MRRSDRLRSYGLLVVVVVVAACGPGGGGGATIDTLADGRPRDVSEPWAAFPVDADPRPIVLVESRAVEPAAGYTTDRGKLAFAAGRFVAPAGAPPLPAGAASGTIDAAAAFEVLTTRAADAKAVDVEPTPVRTVAFGTATFATDRGRRELPAWLFGVDDAVEPIAVLASGPPALFVPSSTPGGVETMFSVLAATIDTAGSALEVAFDGAPAGRGDCTSDYTLEVNERSRTVEIRVRETRRGGGSCKASAVRRAASAGLRRPLGNRVVVDEHGAAVPVTAA